ncbi:MAG: hypothetical protein DRG20_03880 [Deltaproteobacteria bacterium]|nr:hypothetical protein [Deltaproteobacteria bacterium]RLA90006.1 MAG: hypothetical protein DRG20_03880 [Deltaproteobacteria bacterium]
MKKLRKMIFASIVTILLLASIFCFGCSKSNNKESKNVKNNKEEKLKKAIELSQKTLSEFETGKTAEVKFVKSVKLNQEVKVEFRFRDYSGVPKKVSSLKELKKYLKSYKGKAYFRVKEFGRIDKIGSKQARPGKIFYYAIYDFKGFPDNPCGKMIHPSVFREIGWDPAPQLVIIIKGKSRYSSYFYSTIFEKERGIKRVSGLSLNQPNWVTLAAVWYKKEVKKPIFAIKYVDPKGKIKYIKVKY